MPSASFDPQRPFLRAVGGHPGTCGTLAEEPAPGALLHD